MPEWTRIDQAGLVARGIGGAGPFGRDIAGALGTDQIAVRLWTYGPGEQMAYHRHIDQEELYHLVSGGPQELLIEGEGVVVIDNGEWVRLPSALARRIQNRSDRTAVWLTIAAPVGQGVRDGIRVDPVSGRELGGGR